MRLLSRLSIYVGIFHGTGELREAVPFGVRSMKRLRIPVHIFFLCLIFLLFAPALRHPSPWMLGGDIFEFHYFFREFFVSAIRQGIIPWWNPYSFGGAPFVANPQNTPLYPMNVIFLVLPVQWGIIGYIGIHLWIACVGMYRLLRRCTDPVSSMLGGIVFGLSGFFVARISAGHMGMIASAAWTPLLLETWMRSLGTNRRMLFLVASAACFGMQTMAGYQSIAVFSMEILGVAAILQTVRTRSARPFAHLAAVGILGMGLSSFQMVPAVEFVAHSIRTIPLPFEWAHEGASTVASLGMIAAPFILGKPDAFSGPPVNFREHASYVGIGAVSLSAIAILAFVVTVFLPVKLRKRWGITDTPGMKETVLLGICVCFLGILLALSINAPVPIHRMLWDLFPVFRSLRIPSRQLFLSVFGLSILAAYGVSRFKLIWIRGLFTALVGAELLFLGWQTIEPKPFPHHLVDPALAARFTPNPGELFRFLPNFGCWIEPKTALPFNAPMVQGIFSATGYDPMIFRPYYDFIEATNGSPVSSILTNDVQVPYFTLNNPALDSLNVRYILTPTRMADPLGGVGNSEYRLVEENGERQYRVYENTGALPRFYGVPKVQVFPTDAAILAALKSGSLDPTRDIAVTDGSIREGVEESCSSTLKKPVTVRSYGINEIVLETAWECDGYLTGSEIMYPGWTATVDGKSVRLYTGNTVFRTLAVPKGNHIIHFRFVPYSFYVGLAVSIASACLCLLLVRIDRKG